MRSTISALAVLAASLAQSAPGAAQNIPALSGGARVYSIQRPAEQGPRPTVIILHDFEPEGVGIKQAARFASLPSPQGFVSIFFYLQQAQWDYAPAGDAATATGALDDAGFLKNLVDTLVRRGIADPQRIYLAGLGRGGFMALRMICTNADLFAAAALLNSAMPETLGAACRPSRPIPFLMIAGTADRTMPYGGGKVQPENVDNIWPAERLAGFIGQTNGCAGAPEKSTLPRTVPNSVEIETWTHCSGAPLVFYRVIDGANPLPPDLNAGQIALDFFKNKSPVVASLPSGVPAAPPSGPQSNTSPNATRNPNAVTPQTSSQKAPAQSGTPNTTSPGPGAAIPSTPQTPGTAGPQPGQTTNQTADNPGASSATTASTPPDPASSAPAPPSLSSQSASATSTNPPVNSSPGGKGGAINSLGPPPPPDANSGPPSSPAPGANTAIANLGQPPTDTPATPPPAMAPPSSSVPPPSANETPRPSDNGSATAAAPNAPVDNAPPPAPSFNPPPPRMHSPDDPPSPPIYQPPAVGIPPDAPPSSAHGPDHPPSPPTNQPPVVGSPPAAPPPATVNAPNSAPPAAPEPPPAAAIPPPGPPPQNPPKPPTSGGKGAVLTRAGTESYCYSQGGKQICGQVNVSQTQTCLDMPGKQQNCSLTAETTQFCVDKKCTDGPPPGFTPPSLFASPNQTPAPPPPPLPPRAAQQAALQPPAPPAPPLPAAHPSQPPRSSVPAAAPAPPSLPTETSSSTGNAPAPKPQCHLKISRFLFNDTSAVTGSQTSIGGAACNMVNHLDDPGSGSINSQPGNGTLAQTGDFSFRYQPNAGFKGTDRYSVQLCNRKGQCAILTMNVLVL